MAKRDKPGNSRICIENHQYGAGIRAGQVIYVIVENYAIKSSHHCQKEII